MFPIFGDKFVMQIILHVYKSKILHGFDLGNSTVGFDGKNYISLV